MASGSNERMRIPAHTLDKAIQDVCTSYKSAMTNMRNGHIRHFHIRYLKKTKKQKILKIEKNVFGKNKDTFCESSLGNKIHTLDGNNFSDIDSDCIIHYDSTNNRFTLLIPTEIEQRNEQLDTTKRHKYCAFDVGLKELMTGYSNDHVLGIAPEFNEHISVYLKQIDDIAKSDKLMKSQQKRATNKRYNRISNMVNDLQWKVANYVTKNYETILIGNMSTKNIVSKKGNLNNMTKRVAMVSNLYKLRERIKNRCYQNNCSYKLVDEHYTSKMCSYCGNIKDIGSERVYKCNKCKHVIGRDINGGRNIMLLGIQE